ncbi:hypothetical protein PR048_016643 [Dryococelus australis]|uniref:Uncharacterized protein n=1 Tax=Dryococelus australis TaxID=614101 RepID=A0ABQ9H7C3_9NEOP|nr:hypothetical protein PR048_016643 [Dryococelus australis]
MKRNKGKLCYRKPAVTLFSKARGFNREVSTGILPSVFIIRTKLFYLLCKETFLEGVIGDYRYLNECWRSIFPTTSYFPPDKLGYKQTFLRSGFIISCDMRIPQRTSEAVLANHISPPPPVGKASSRGRKPDTSFVITSLQYKTKLQTDLAAKQNTDMICLPNDSSKLTYGTSPPRVPNEDDVAVFLLNIRRFLLGKANSCISCPSTLLRFLCTRLLWFHQRRA